MNRNVVITGLGVVSPVGIGIEAFWQALLDRASGIAVRPELESTRSPFRLWAPVRDFEGKQYIKPRKAIKVMCPPIQFGYVAAKLAAEQAGILEGAGDRQRIGTVFGADAFFADPHDVVSAIQKCRIEGRFMADQWGEQFSRQIEPLWMLKYLPNMVASHISIALDARGPSNSICHGESSGLSAIIEGVSLVERRTADAVVAGGTGWPIEWTGMVYRGVERLSRRIDDPDQAVRPFDADRDGTVLGEGAGAIVLESAEVAEARGATILARVLGRGRRFSPPGNRAFVQAIAGAIEQALSDAEIAADEIALVSAHGSAEPDCDAAEAQAIHQTLGDVPVIAQKGNIGQIGPGGSVLELATAILSLNRGQLPPTRNHFSTGADCPIQVVAEPRPIDGRYALKLSLSTTGQINTLVIERGSDVAE